jgi:hypothetical protein
MPDAGCAQDRDQHGLVRDRDHFSGLHSGADEELPDPFVRSRARAFRDAAC